MPAAQPPNVEVAVVGGGAIGLTVAWRAAQRGCSVCVLDRGALGGGASHVAAGMLAPVTEVEFGEAGFRQLELGLASARLWPEFAVELETAAGIDVGWRESGTLVVARDEDEGRALERELAFRRRLGLVVEALRPSQARRLEGALAPSLRSALLVAGDHSVDPRALTEALAIAAQRAGATLRPETPVAGLELAGGRVTGLRLADGAWLGAERVVLAAGAWSDTIDGLPGWARVPVRPVKGQIVVLRDPSGPGLVQRVLRFEGGYLVPRADGRYVLGATMEERGFDRRVTVGGVLELLREAHALVPGLEELELVALQAGLRPGTPDNAPIIGPGALAGLVWATGHHRNGILLAPLTAQMVADELTGEPGGPWAALTAPGRWEPAAASAGSGVSGAGVGAAS
ncbi:MAG TPA: glycine oxidase ThiO [Solirubrobacteraceae bacterium]|nr:glycine oxidase ThiO [Solirubrobacteraceae bacterium]